MNKSYLSNSFSRPLRYAFYDLETTGINTRADQPVQTCIIETDADLNVIESNGAPLIHDFKTMLRPDIIPSPEAFMVHKIDPLSLYGKSHESLFCEYDSAEKMREIFLRTQNTCIAGFNSIGFDDEMTRHTNFRNLLDPYEHEWKNGNHRTDIYMLSMLVRLYSESILNWHKNDDGNISLKLEDICKANGISHGMSHDAKNDVLDTIAITKLIKERRPELFSRFKQMSDKNYVKALLSSENMLVSTSKYTPRDQYSTTFVLPVNRDPSNANRYYGIDLSKDLSLLLTGTPEEIGNELFTKNTDKTQAPLDTGIYTITANKLPLLTTPNPREGEPNDAGYRKVAEKTGIDYDLVKRNEEMVRNNFPKIKGTVREVFDRPPQEKVHDVFLSLYSGSFLTDSEKSLRQRQRLPTGQGSTYLTSEPIVDKFRAFKENMSTHAEIMLRTKWNNFFKDILSKDNLVNVDPNEIIIFRDYLKKALFDKESELGLTIDEYKQRVGAIKVEWDLDEQDFKNLDSLDRHVDRVLAFYEYVDNICHQNMEKAKEIRATRPNDYDKCFHQKFEQQTFNSKHEAESQKIGLELHESIITHGY